jgi:alpha-tubulin suppressor-like RCC1 family protein
VYLIRTKDDTVTARTITWPSGFVWDGGTEPTLLTNETENEAQIFKLTTRDNGATWYGVEVVNYSAYIAPPRTLYSWGYAGRSDGGGALGQNQGPSAHYSSPVQIPGTTWMNVQCGNAVSQSAFKTDGTLWVWGRNSNYGKLGLNDRIDRSSPVQLPGGWKTFTPYGGGSLGMKSDGTLWATGNNAAQNNITNYSSPVQIPGTWKITSPASNGNNRAAINTDSELYVWGSIGEGNGFTGNVTQYSSPIQIPGSWGSVRTGVYVITGVKTDGTLWMSGRNHGGVDGSLGQNDRTQYSSPVQVPGTWQYGAGKVAGGDFGCMALRTDGTLWVWGRNANGELGQNDTNSRSSPVQVPGTNWALIEPGYVNNYAIKTDGTLWAWGRNEHGALGQNNIIEYSSPVQIPGTYPTSVLTDGFAIISASYGTVSVLK